MKLKVTQKGVHQGGEAVEVGQVIEIDVDQIPASLVGKVQALEGGEKTAVTNPKEGAVPNERDELKKQAAELDLDYPKNIPTDKLKELVDKALEA